MNTAIEYHGSQRSQTFNFSFGGWLSTNVKVVVTIQTNEANPPIVIKPDSHCVVTTASSHFDNQLAFQNSVQNQPKIKERLLTLKHSLANLHKISASVLSLCLSR